MDDDRNLERQLRAFAATLQHHVGEPIRPDTPVVELVSHRRRRWLIGAGALAAVAAIVVGLLVVVTRPHHARQVTPVGPTLPTATTAPLDPVDALRARPIVLPKLTAGQNCPVTTAVSSPSTDIGPLLGDGPVRAAGLAPDAPLLISHGGVFAGSDWGGEKVLLAMSATVDGPALVRGRQIDGDNEVRFDDGIDPAAEKVLDAQGPPLAGGWYGFPGYTRLRAGGCYGLQIDTAAATTTIVFRAADTAAEDSTSPSVEPATTTNRAYPTALRWSDVAPADVAWEATRIPVQCGDVWWQQQQLTEQRCTQLAVDPAGVPVTFDPASRTVTRQTRDGGPVQFRLADEYVDPNLLAAGPDDIAYFSLDNKVHQAADVIAVSVAAGDTGDVLERLPEALPDSESDLYLTDRGIVLSGWHDQGFRPALDAAPLVEWLRRDPSAAPGLGVPPLAAFDDAGGQVAAAGRQWALGDRLVTTADHGGSGRALATFDGGFIAIYTEHTGDRRAEVMRGYRNGTVEHWQLPVSWNDVGTPILEPHGTFLLPDGDHYVRVAPFPAPSNGWDGRLQVDVGTGTATAPGLDEFLAGFIDSLPESKDTDLPWKTPSIGFADAVAGPTTSPAELRTVTQSPDDPNAFVVTTEGHLDDSVYGTRLVIHTSYDGHVPVIERIDWSNTCQPGRGHQDYSTDLCT